MNRHHNPVEDSEKIGKPRDESKEKTGKDSSLLDRVEEGNQGQPGQELKIEIRKGKNQKDSGEKADKRSLFFMDTILCVSIS